MAAAMTLPPGLAFPPGLEPPPGLTPPPGLGADEEVPEVPAAVEDPTVRVVNLPNHLMNKAIMEVTLEQANLDKYVVKFDVIPGPQRGEAIITLTSFAAAERCAHHFNGRRWDASGTVVRAEVLNAPVIPAVHPAFVFSSAVPEFVPLQPFAFSSDVPEFVPRAEKKRNQKVKVHQRRGSASQSTTGSASQSTTGSDISTNDSSSGDEK